MAAVDVRHVCDSRHLQSQVPILMIFVMCLPARLAESCRHINQSPGLQAATDVCVSCVFTISNANLNDARVVPYKALSH